MMRRMMFNRRWLFAALAVLAAAAALVLAGLLRNTGKDPEEGKMSLTAYGCSSCHTIPGIPLADGIVGPPLDFWASRSYIAGSLVNTQDNLILWITDPQFIEPGTAMPPLQVSDEDAHDMAAYLYTLKAPDRGMAGMRGYDSGYSLPLPPSENAEAAGH